MLKKDLIISVSAHLLIALVIVVLNPAMGMFRDKPEIMIVKPMDFVPGGGPKAGQDEPAKIAPTRPSPPEPVDDAAVIKSKEKKEADKPREKKKEPTKPKEKIKPEPEKREAEPVEEKSDHQVRDDGKGGLEVQGAAVGTGVGAGIGAGSSNLPYNLGLVLNVIERNWRNPVTAPNSISCTIYFQIDRRGNVIGEPVIERSSGIAVFDQGAVSAIKRAKQFPAFPSNFDYEYIGLHLDFEYVPEM